MSATLGIARENRASINANHINMCKFRDSFDKSLIVTVQVIKELCEDIFSATAPSIPVKQEVNGARIRDPHPSTFAQSDSLVL